MDESARLQLQNMIRANNVEDQTELIRSLKHSSILKTDIQNLVLLKEKYPNPNDMDTLQIEAMSTCSFLFTYYTDIYNKIRKDEIDLMILFKFLGVLERIEKGELDQHEGSFLVGTLLKELYIDSALKRANKLDKLNQNNNNGSQDDESVEPIEISWKQFKKIQ